MRERRKNNIEEETEERGKRALTLRTDDGEDGGREEKKPK